MKTKTAEELAALIADDYGETVDDLLERYALDSVVPGACHDCGLVVDSCEPDMRHGYCDNCGGNKVRSILVLEGII